jgi:signal transduction histidine kinase
MKESAQGPQAEAASEIMDQVDRLELWVRELLTYVHLPHGEPQLLDLEGVLRSSLGQFSGELRRRGIESTVDLPPDLPPVRGDTILVAQVFRSLLSNAVEAMPQGGRLALGAAMRPAGHLTIEVKDSGVGMNDDQLKRALKPFHSTKAKGLGIGLPLARRIVERMGGGISLASRLGEGTVVRVTLPSVRA